MWVWVWDVGVANPTNLYCGPHQDIKVAEGPVAASWPLTHVGQSHLNANLVLVCVDRWNFQRVGVTLM